MGVRRTSQRFSTARLAATARRLLKASTLCAIATVSPGGRAHVNTAYFGWSPTFDIVWLSAPQARHSRNLRANRSAAVAVYDSTLRWGGPDRGIQMFGTAREVTGQAARAAERVYARRFRTYSKDNLPAYRFYAFRPRRLKLFHERDLGGGVFVTATVGSNGRVAWERTETYGVE
jgi:uncharacterized protein YhbP (UPF0306 family)